MYLDLIFLMNVAFNLLIFSLTNYISRANKRFSKICIATIFASMIVPLELLYPDTFIDTLAFKWGYIVVIILFLFGFHSLYALCRHFATFLFVMFTVGGGLYGLQFIAREIKLPYRDYLLFVKNINGEPISLLFLFLCFPVVLLFMKNMMDRHVKEKIKYDQLYTVSLELGGIQKTTVGYIDSGNQLTDPFSKRPVVLCDQTFLKQFFEQEEWGELIRAMDALELNHLPKALENRVTVVPYQGVGGQNQLLYTFKPDELIVYYENCKYVTSKVLVGIQTADLTADGSYHCLLHPEMIRLKMKPIAS